MSVALWLFGVAGASACRDDADGSRPRDVQAARTDVAGTRSDACGDACTADVPTPDVAEREDAAPAADERGGCRMPAECDDGNPCTAEICDPTGTCFHPTIGGSCDDGDACTTDDSCVQGGCVGRPVTCLDEDDDLCTEAVCRPPAGCATICRDDAGCLAECGGDRDCDDDDPSSIDVCVMRSCSSACTHYWPPCDDQNPCTADRPDDQGVCRHVPLDGVGCDDANACTAADRCVGTTCVGLLVSCDDDNPCTADRCLPETGCVSQPLPDGLDCDDGDACTLGERCQSSFCVGQQRQCAEDGDACSLEYCDPAEGCLVFCRHSGECAPRCSGDTECLDADPCSLDECRITACSARCQHVPDPCDDDNPCTLDSCDEGGCRHDEWCRQCVVDRDCADSDPCTVDRCSADLLCEEGVLVVCPEDGDPCTNERCVESGCVSECLEDCGEPCEDDADCGDADACTVDSCVDTPCGPRCEHPPLACEPSAPCTAARCVRGECIDSVPAVVPTLDGRVGDDWHPRSLAAVEPDESDWPAAGLELLRIQVDHNLLYLEVSGHADGPAQAVVGFIDVVDEQGHGVTRLSDLQAQGGTLDTALAGCAVLDVEGFEVDFAFGTVGMSSAYGAADRAGWRRVSGNGGLRWMPEGAVVANAEAGGFEAVVTLDALLPTPVPPEGAALSLVILVTAVGECAYADQSLPDQPEPLTEPVVSVVHRFVVQPLLLDCCAAPDDCRDGDPCTFDACDDGACFHLETECGD